MVNRGSKYNGKRALAEVGWLSVRELVQYHSLLQAKKTLETEKPAYLHRKLVGESQREARYLTRQKVGGDSSSQGNLGGGGSRTLGHRYPLTYEEYQEISRHSKWN